MLTDDDLDGFRVEASLHPECIECRVIRRLLDEVNRLRLFEASYRGQIAGYREALHEHRCAPTSSEG